MSYGAVTMSPSAVYHAELFLHLPAVHVRMSGTVTLTEWGWAGTHTFTYFFFLLTSLLF